MANRLDFAELRNHLVWGRINSAKRMVTSQNVLCVDDDGITVIQAYCMCGPDDANVLRHFMDLGATLSWTTNYSPLCLAAQRGSKEITRALLTVGACVDEKGGCDVTPLDIAIYYVMKANRRYYSHRNCALLLIDAGANISLVRDTIPKWALDFVEARNKARGGSLVIMGLVMCRSRSIGQNGKDVLKMIARCVWKERCRM